jgi:hypothetical protein
MLGGRFLTPWSLDGKMEREKDKKGRNDNHDFHLNLLSILFLSTLEFDYICRSYAVERRVPIGDPEDPDCYSRGRRYPTFSAKQSRNRYWVLS